MDVEERIALAAEIENEVRPLLSKTAVHGGYDCCGCSTYDAILDHVLTIVTRARSTANGK